MEDFNLVMKEELNKDKHTPDILFKYEKCKILSERCQQLSDGADTFIEYDENDNIYDIALKELYSNKIPFIVKRTVNGKDEYFKLNTLSK